MDILFLLILIIFLERQNPGGRMTPGVLHSDLCCYPLGTNFYQCSSGLDCYYYDHHIMVTNLQKGSYNFMKKMSLGEKLIRTAQKPL